MVLGAALVVLGAMDGTPASADEYLPPARLIALQSPTGMVATPTRIYVTEQNDIKVVDPSTQHVVSTIAGFPGAASPVLTGDYSTLVVAAVKGHQLAEVSTIDNTIKSVVDTVDCPHSLQLVGPTLWYLGGCSAPYSIFESSVDDLKVHTQVGSLTTDLDGDHALRAASGWLTLTSQTGTDVYSLTGSTALTYQRTLDVGGFFEPQVLTGNSIFGTLGTGYARVDLTTGNLTAFYGALGRTAMAYSAVGDLVGVGVSYGGRYDMYVDDGATGARRVSGKVFGGRGVSPSRVDLLTFSTDGQLLYGLEECLGGRFLLFTSTTSRPAQLKVSLRVSAPRAFGQPVHATALVTDAASPVPGVVVHFHLRVNGVQRVVDASTDSVGRAQMTVSVAHPGSVVATTDNSLTTAGFSSRTIHFAIPAKLVTFMSPARSTRRGVLHYSSASDVTSSAKLLPTRAGVTVRLQLQMLKGSSWRIVDRLQINTDKTSRVYVRLGTVLPRVEYRIVYLRSWAPHKTVRAAAKPFVVS